MEKVGKRKNLVKDYQFYDQLNLMYPFLYIHQLPFEWFLFIFKGRPYDEIENKFYNINGYLEYETETYSMDRPICPNLKHIWRWTEFCSPEEVKVVILGQDPYVNYQGEKGSGKFSIAASGYGFSLDTDYFNEYIRPEPVYNINHYSFKTIINKVYDKSFRKYLRRDGDGDGDLTSWCRQGVLMLDYALTTVGSKANAHKNIGWDYITRLVIERLGEPPQPRKVFMFWKKDFEAIFANSVDESSHLTIFRCHPASYIPGTDQPECSHKCWTDPEMDCFVEADEFLAKLPNSCPINWNPLHHKA